MRITIYALLDPRDKRIRYVGKTKMSPEKRLRSHIKEAIHRRADEQRRCIWINELLELLLIPEVLILDDVDESSWQEAERSWIAKMRMVFPDLLNSTAGGNGTNGYKQSDREKRLRGDAVKRTYEAKSAEAKELIAAAIRENFAKPEIREKLSAAQKLSCNRQEIRAARSLARKGMVLPEQWRRHISESHRGLKQSDETKQKRSRALTGIKRSAETRLKMSVAQCDAHRRRMAEKVAK